ncbi:MAG: ABC transporter permease [Vicinamibacterales bacterium]
MTALRRLAARLRELVTRGRVERELHDEIRHHLDLLAEDYVRRGWSPEDARREARRAFGGVDQAVEAVRDRRGFRLVDTVRRDVREAVRSLVRTPAFTLAAVLTLAMGVGVNTAIFTLVDAVLVRPLPYPAPDRLVALWETLPAREAVQPGAPESGGPPARVAVAPANLADYQARVGDLATFAAWSQVGRNVIGPGGPERLTGEEVTAAYFDVLGIPPATGRTFRADEFVPGRDAVIVLGYGLWQRQFGGDAGVLGRSIELDGGPREIVGIMPRGFVAASALDGDVDFWIPAAYPPDILAGRGEHIVEVAGRLAPGVTLDAVRQRLATVPGDIAREDPRSAGLGVAVDVLQADQVRATAPLLVALLWAVGLILVTACANVAGLLVVRAGTRTREVAVRVALGASRGRVLLALATESAVLATLGTAAGLALGSWTTAALVAAAPPGLPRLDSVTFGGRTLAFAAVLAAVTTILVGLLPAWRSSGTHPSSVLRSSGRGVTGAWLRRTRSVLLAGEIALSLVLLVGAVLMARSLATLNAVDLGFDPHQVLAARVSLDRARYEDADRRLAFFEAAEAAVRRIPGVRDVAFGNRLPLRGNWTSGMELRGADGAGVQAIAGFQAVSPGYLATFRLPLRRGRWIADGDRARAAQVAVVNEAFARELLDGADPVGRQFRRTDASPWATIVGVVGDVRRGGRTTGIEPQVYVPAAQTAQYPLWLSDVGIRTDGDPRAVSAQVRDAIWSVDPRLPVTLVRTLDETLALGQAEREFQTWLFLVFAGLALALAVVGTYGVVAYAVSQKTAEIGLRMALGAGAARVLGWVLRQAAAPVATGAAAGLVAAWFLSRFVASLLFGIEATDAPSYGAAVAVVTGVAAAAGLLAGRRATRVDPASVLK